MLSFAVILSARCERGQELMGRCFLSGWGINCLLWSRMLASPKIYWFPTAPSSLVANDISLRIKRYSVGVPSLQLHITTLGQLRSSTPMYREADALLAGDSIAGSLVSCLHRKPFRAMPPSSTTKHTSWFGHCITNQGWALHRSIRRISLVATP
jgi:hypothetical protein